MTLSPEIRKLWNIYIDEKHPDTAARSAFAASDDLVLNTLIAWQESAEDARVSFIASGSAALKKANEELIVIRTTTVPKPVS